MTPLPSPDEIWRVFTIPGIFEPVGHRFLDRQIEVSGVLAVAARRVPIRLSVQGLGPIDRPGAAPGGFQASWTPVRPQAGFDTDVRRAGDHLLKVLEPLLDGVPWIAAVIGRPLPATRRWFFGVPGASRTVTGELVSAADGPDDLDIYVQLHSNCVQHCGFCPVSSPAFSVSNQDSDLEFVTSIVDRVVVPARRNGVFVTMSFDADDISAHRHLGAILGLVHDASGCPIHLTMPPNSLASPPVARAVMRLPGLFKLSTSVFGSTAATHDSVAGRSGAFTEAVRAMRNLAGAPVQVQGRFVLTAAALPEIGPAVDILVHFGFDVTIQSLFADNVSHQELLGGITPDMALVRRRLGESAGRLMNASRLVNVSIVDFPVCAVPPELRPFMRNDHRRADLFGHSLTPGCEGCVHSDRCTGVSAVYRKQFGLSGVLPESP